MSDRFDIIIPGPGAAGCPWEFMEKAYTYLEKGRGLIRMRELEG